MASRVLRSRTAEAQPASQVSPAGEDVPPRDNALGDNVDSADETDEPTLRDPQEQVGASAQTMSEEVEVNENRGQSPSAGVTGQLELMLATFMSAMQRENALLKESIRADIRTESEKVLQRFELQAQELRREFTNQMNVESRRVTGLVSQIKSESQSELVAVKRQLRSIGEDFDSRLNQANTSSQVVINEPADRVEEHRAEVNDELARLKESLGNYSEALTHDKSVVERSLGQVNAKVSELESKFNEQTTKQISAPEARAVSRDSISPSVAQVHGPTVEPEGTLGNGGAVGEDASCSCRPAHCTSSSDSSLNVCSMHATSETVTLSSFLSNSELPLPLFDDATETNPVFHLRRLEEFINFRGVPRPLRLALACRSIVGQIGKQWVEAISHHLQDYEGFKKAFLNHWWSTSRQALAKCTLYQTKYDRRSGLTLSAHFLKFATTASYLEPRPSDIEVIEAIRSHFPVVVQRAMLTNQLHTIEETLDLLKRVEIVEMTENFPRTNIQSTQNSPNVYRQGNNPPRNDPRGQTQAQVRQVNHWRSRNRSNGNRGRNFRYQDARRGGETSGGSSGPLDSTAPPYSARQELVGHSRSEN